MKFKNSKEAGAKRRELLDAQSEVNDKLIVLEETLAKRELKDAEKQEHEALTRKFNKMQREIDLCSREYTALYQAEKAEKAAREKAVKVSTGEQLREALKTARVEKNAREIVLGSGKDGDVASSGAVNLNIHDMIPTLNEGLGLPKGVSIVTGVTGNELWPVSLDDAEFEETGETVELQEQDLHFDNISPEVHRSGATFSVSNAAIDNAAFDLMGLVRSKITLAESKYLAKKVYSQAKFTGVKGPFSGMTPKGTITLDASAYKNLLLAIANFSKQGYDDADACLVMDKQSEAELKATPKAVGQGGFVIENGKCAGYDYVTSHYINTTLDTEGKKLVDTADRFIGIGLFKYLAVQQHGMVRLTVDPVSGAKRNVTLITVNTAWSMTDLSVKTTTNGNENTTTTAFALYKVAEPAAASGSDGSGK